MFREAIGFALWVGWKLILGFSNAERGILVVEPISGPTLSGAELEALLNQGPCCAFGAVLRALAEPEVALWLGALAFLALGLGIVLIRLLIRRRPRGLELPVR